MEDQKLEWTSNPIYFLSSSASKPIPVKRQNDIHNIWKNTEVHSSGLGQLNVGFSSARSNDHLPQNPSNNDDRIWTNLPSTYSAQNFGTQRPINPATPVHTRRVTSYKVQQHLSSPQCHIVTPTSMTAPSYVQMRPRIPANYDMSQLQDDPRYISNQGTEAMYRKEPTGNLQHQWIPHDVNRHYSRPKAVRDKEIEALKNELQEMKRNMRKMEEVILQIIANDIRNQQHQQNGSAVETQQYSAPSQYLPNDVNTHMITKHHYKGVPNAEAEIQPWNTNNNPGITKPVGFEKHSTGFKDYPKNEEIEYVPESTKHQSYGYEPRQLQENEETVKPRNQSPQRYSRIRKLSALKTVDQGYEDLKIEHQHFMNFQRDKSTLVQDQSLLPPQQLSYQPEHNLISSALKAQPKYGYESSSQREKHSDRKRVISLSYLTEEDAIPLKNPRQNQMASSSTAPGQSVLPSHPILARTMQSPFTKPETAWKELPQQQFVYENGVVNQRPLIHQEMQEKKYMYYQQTAIDEKGTRREKARRCYSCREPGHLADNCCKVADPDIVDDLSLTNDTALDLSISKY